MPARSCTAKGPIAIPHSSSAASTWRGDAPSSSSNCASRRYARSIRFPIKPGQFPATTASLPSRFARASAVAVTELCGGLPRYDLQQAHDICGTEEVKANDAFRARASRGNLIDVQIRRIAGQNRSGFGEPAQFGEHRPLHFDVFEDRFDDDVCTIEAGIGPLAVEFAIAGSSFHPLRFFLSGPSPGKSPQSQSWTTRAFPAWSLSKEPGFLHSRNTWRCRVPSFQRQQPRRLESE